MEASLNSIAIETDWRI